MLLLFFFKYTREGLTDVEKADMIAKLSALDAEYDIVDRMKTTIQTATDRSLINVKKNISTVNDKFQAIQNAQANNNSTDEIKNMIDGLTNYIQSLISEQVPVSNKATLIEFTNINEQAHFKDIVKKFTSKN